VASVVIAAVGLLINSSIQNAQIAASKENTVAQTTVAKQNNDAQLALTERTAALTRQLQEGTLSTQLLEAVTNGSTPKRQLAIVVLRRSLPPDLYQDLITIVVTSKETDPAVRKTALEQASKLRDVAPSVAQAIARIALDTDRPNDERQLANVTVGQLGLQATASSNTYMLSASGADQNAYSQPDGRGGIFTEYLIRGLNGEAALRNTHTLTQLESDHVDQGPNITFSALSRYLSAAVASNTSGRQTVVSLQPSSSEDPIIVGSGTNYSNVVLLAIGNDIYPDTSFSRFPFSVGAELFARFWKERRSTNSVNFLKNATRAEILSSLSQISNNSSPDSLEIVYYSGRAFSDINGVGYLVPVDVDPKSPDTTSISTLNIRDILSRSSSKIQLLIMDAAFPSIAVSSAR
jgi:hypothetical protein